MKITTFAFYKRGLGRQQPSPPPPPQPQEAKYFFNQANGGLTFKVRL